ISQSPAPPSRTKAPLQISAVDPNSTVMIRNHQTTKIPSD
ncbi:hypothetical protein L195_g051228, partial [Trifolium pratense]